MDRSALSDHELLRHYADDRFEPAFAELVRRHLNLVYSAARRQTRSPELARDIAQSVFIDLARAANDFDPRTPVIAWLHLVTRRTAIDAVRRESRRRQREHAAATDPAAMNSPHPPSPWSQLEPHLDEVLTGLSEPERTAVLLRFFENKSLREVGVVLGTSEEAARKRVARALDQLRAGFVRRGLTLTSATLAADLSAHAIEAAPAALNAAISSAAIASTAGASIAVLKTTHVILMTTFQKSALVAALVLTAGAGLYEAVALQRESARLELLQARATELSADLSRARADAAASAQQLVAVDAKIDERLASAPSPSLSATDAAATAQMKTWLANIGRMKAVLKLRPEYAIPELSLVDEGAWFDIAAQMSLDTDEDLRRALAQLRQRGENQLGMKVMAALGAFMKSGATVLPETPAGLLPYFDPPIAPEMLDRYEMLQKGPIGALSKKDANYAIVGAKTPADAEYDSLWRTGISGFALPSAIDENVRAAQRQFALANNGQKATSAAQLLPLLKWPVATAAVEKYLVRNPPTVGKPGSAPSP